MLRIPGSIFPLLALLVFETSACNAFPDQQDYDADADFSRVRNTIADVAERVHRDVRTSWAEEEKHRLAPPLQSYAAWSTILGSEHWGYYHDRQT